jgi:hypothetical protein
MEILTLKSSHNIWTYKASELFHSSEKKSFISKKEAVLWTYEASVGTVILLGIIRDGVSYLFTNEGNGLEDCSLFPSNWDGVNEIKYENELIILPEDLVIVFEKEESDSIFNGFT